MQAYLYRFKVAAGREDAFVGAWSSVTRALRSLGGLGSRLHRGDDAWWYAYAQWTDAAARTQAFAAASAVDGYAAAAATMRDCIVEGLPEIALEPVADLLVSAA
jgi:hypothetical protein